jgi:hypothetical protein
MTAACGKAESNSQSSRRGLFWIMVPVVLLGASFVGLVSLAVIASSDPSFAVERDYYQRAVAWDDHLAELAESARLGWAIAVVIRPQRGGAELTASLLDRNGQAVHDAKLSLEAFHNARRNLALLVDLEPDRHGRYRRFVPMHKSGLWEFRFRAKRADTRFVQTLRGDVDLTVPVTRIAKGAPGGA